MICSIYPNLKSTLTSEDVKRLFTLRYAIDSLNSQLKDQSNKQDKNHTEEIAIYRGAQTSKKGIEELKSAVGGLVAKISFVCGCLNENKEKCFATGDMNNPYKQPIMQKINIPINSKTTYARLSHEKETSDKDIIILPYLSLFRIDKMIRTECFWCLEATLIDKEDEQYRSLIGPWAKLIDKPYRLQSNIHQTSFHYLGVDNTCVLRFQVLVDALLRLEPNEFAKQELIECCRLKYADNTKILSRIDTFEQTYRSEDAISWYSRNCFLYRILNEALRQVDYDTIVKLRYFIHNLHNQLARLQIDYLRSLPKDQPNIVVYRGQKMSITELEHLRQHQCSLISMNSFLSTTNNHEAAAFFSGEGIAQIEEGYASVIFKISVDTRQPVTIPFARIDYQSIFKDEEEILFSMGAVFRIQHVEKIHDKLWHVKLMLDRNIDDEQWLLLTSHLSD